MGYIQGEGRQQSSLFPPTLEELVLQDHLVRVIEAYVARLDLQALGFGKAQPSRTGRPAYDPADLLKLYLYGYFQRIRSSRRLQAECQRNIEVMWLLGRLAPDFKTIADFRKDNGQAFSATCRAFVQFCRRVGLITGELVAIDGSKFQAVASARKHLSLKQLKRQQQRLEQRIADYLAQLEAADQAEAGESIDRAAVKVALQQLQGKHADNQTLLEAQGLEQFVVGEADARKMRTHLGSRVAYNVQSAVDAEHCLILHHEVTQDGTDNQQLEPMAKASQTVLRQGRLDVVADAGYSNGAQFQACEEAEITAYVPPNRAINNQGDGQHFDRSAFVYDAQQDHYLCPAGHVLKLKQLNRGHRLYTAHADDCASCPLKTQCTQARQRYLRRHAHEDAFERMEQRLETRPEMMNRRRSIVEHPFGNLKQWLLGNGRFLLRQLGGTRTEMALAVQAYNLKRAINVLGARRMIELLV
ncbi:IS5/IS1182 family transposase [Stutzerimonas stutzeri]|uniref:IS5/IS1182 family transposase n=1 Tax=Stutzerimonas stutzeri TaxID=316 RepID=A0A2N8T3P4_STUST|nr:IS1182 family transposase [Stutzerimonas stutzeri]MCQ4323791.1 IS1182 family transposase [Stutzerimonas stutzeri]PNG09371.1 IS5/IS1182 family transposase [Stutzerimonas stutzeri]